MKSLRDSIDERNNSERTRQRATRRLERLARAAEQSPKIPKECRFGHTQLFALEARHLK